MTPLDAFWHVLNFLALPVFMAWAMAAWVKWRGAAALRGVPWWRWGWPGAGLGLAVSALGLLVLGSDGKSLVHAGVVGVNALYWAWVARRR